MKKIWTVAAVVALSAVLGGCAAGGVKDFSGADENGVEIIIVQTPSDTIRCAKSSSGLSCEW